MKIRILAFSCIALALAACGPPRSIDLQGGVCQSIKQDGYKPFPTDDVVPPTAPPRIARLAVEPPPAQITVSAAHRPFREMIARQFNQADRGREPVHVLSMTAGGAWGAFSAGFFDGWGQNTGPDRRPAFDIVTGVSTGSMIAPVAFLNRPRDVEWLRKTYRELANQGAFTTRSYLSLLSSTSLFDTAPLRRKVEEIVDDGMIEAIGQQRGQRVLAVMAVDLDSGLPEIFDLTDIAADSGLVPAARRKRFIDAVMASAAIPIAFPPVFIDGNLYVDGGVRRHAFITREVLVALRGVAVSDPDNGAQTFSLSPDGRPLDLAIIVSGDMKVLRDCVGRDGLDLLAIARRTANVATDQLLRDSVESLVTHVGQARGNRARYIDASTLVDYPMVGGAQPVTSLQGKCTVPNDSRDIFDKAFQACLDAKGFALGRDGPIPWNPMVRSPVTARTFQR